MKMDKPPKELPALESKRSLLDDMLSDLQSPNTQNEAKKRKLSSTPDGDSGTFSKENLSEIRQEESDVNRIKEKEVANRQVCKIYCQHEDPKIAIEKIKELKNCLSVHEPKSFSENNQNIETGVKTIWQFFGLSTCPDKDFSPDLNAIKSFIGGPGVLESDKILDAFKLISQCTTTIKMIHDNGYEYWIVTDFEKGPGISKWYRGQAFDSFAAEKFAFLNLAGIKIPALDEKGQKDVSWLEFAKKSAFDEGIIFNKFSFYWRQANFKRDPSSRWSFGPNSAWGSEEAITIRKTHPTFESIDLNNNNLTIYEYYKLGMNMKIGEFEFSQRRVDLRVFLSCKDDSIKHVEGISSRFNRLGLNFMDTCFELICLHLRRLETAISR